MVFCILSLHGIYSPSSDVSLEISRPQLIDLRSRQDLLSFAMMAPASGHERIPYRHPIQSDLAFSDPIFSGMELSSGFCGDIAACFHNLRHLNDIINGWDETQPMVELVSFSEIRADTVHRLQSVANTKPASDMTNLDYQVEICRLAALIYIRVVFQLDSPLCSRTRILKDQAIRLIKQGEADGRIDAGARQQPTSVTWALFLCGVVCLNSEEQECFAQVLGKGIRSSGIETWLEMEHCLREICWLGKLQTSRCWSLWSRMMIIR